MGGVFINYRGEDTDTAASLVDRELSARFGSDQVFLDCRSILVGTSFAQELLGRLRACSVLLVVIGPRWLTLTDPAGRRRIDNPADWVRREIVEALNHGLRVIPVLTGNAPLPAAADLPKDIAELSGRQYVSLRRRYTSPDLDFLVKRITEADPELAKLAAQRQSKANAAVRRRHILTTVAALGAVVLALTGGVLWSALHAATPGTGLGPEVLPPTGYGHVARLLSANDFAIEERSTATQPSVLAVAARPTDANSQRWAFWYGDQFNPDPMAVVLEAYSTNGKSAPSQGSVIDLQPSGSTFVTQVKYSSTQFWTFHEASSAWYQIANHQQLCLTAVQVDAPLQVRTCDGGAGQRWKVTDITDGGA